jgi:hypothetical protein
VVPIACVFRSDPVFFDEGPRGFRAVLMRMNIRLIGWKFQCRDTEERAPLVLTLW